MYYCVSELIFIVTQEISARLLLKIIDSEIRKVGKTFKLPEHFFYFVQNIRSQKETVRDGISTSEFFRFQIINVFKIFRESFGSCF